MLKKVILSFIIIVFSLSYSVLAKENKDIKVSNSIFSITMPQETQGTFQVRKRKKGIYIYHKESKKSGFGGFVFGIQPFLNPSDYASYPGSKKLGELKDKKNKLYDIVLIQPTDVQYDYTKSPKAPKSYKTLYDLAEKIAINGEKRNKYYKAQGTKGQNLYKEIIEKHITAIKENWKPEKLEKENMSYMYYQIPKNKIGYTFYDVNGDGIEELLIGEIAQGDWKGIVYDMYTMVNRHPKHVISGWSRNRYYVCNDTFVCNEYSSGANESGLRTYILIENSTELYPQVNFKYDGYQNSQKPWFISYSDEKWENVSEKIFNERKSVFERYIRFNYTPIYKQLN